jgi:hypothetical protein
MVSSTTCESRVNLTNFTAFCGKSYRDPIGDFYMIWCLSCDLLIKAFKSVILWRFYRGKIERCVGSILHMINFNLKAYKWIRPAPRASGLCQKWQCRVPFSYEERQTKLGMFPWIWEATTATLLHRYPHTHQTRRGSLLFAFCVPRRCWCLEPSTLS